MPYRDPGDANPKYGVEPGDGGGAGATLAHHPGGGRRRGREPSRVRVAAAHRHRPEAGHRSGPHAPSGGVAAWVDPCAHGTRGPRPPRGRPTRSHKHGPRRTPDTARGLHARRAASPAAPVAPRPGRARASRRARAARGPWAAPTLAPEQPVSSQSKPPLGTPA